MMYVLPPFSVREHFCKVRAGLALGGLVVLFFVVAILYAAKCKP